MEELAADTLLLRTRVERLEVRVFANRAAMGEAAGRAAAELLRQRQEVKSPVHAVFAAAPSQTEMLATLVAEERIDWAGVVALQMDEYVGLPRGAPQSFGHYLSEHLYRHVRPGEVHYIDSAAEPETEAARYGALVEEGVDLCCMGIGENGHIAFNEPGQADFGDPQRVRLVGLDRASRLQQVHDGCFTTLDEVPRQALTMTVPALMAATHVVCTVPGPTKEQAVTRTLWGAVTPTCPASALRSHPNAVLFLDRDSWPGESG